MVGKLDLGLPDLPYFILTICLTEFQHWLSESERIPQDKGEPESRILINTQSKRSNGNGIRCRGHVASEKIALNKTGQGETSKCLLPISPISALGISQRFSLGNCVISALKPFSQSHQAQQTLYSVGMMGFYALFTHIPPACPPSSPAPVRSREMAPLLVVSLWDSHSHPFGRQEKLKQNREAPCAQVIFRSAEQFFIWLLVFI